MDNQKPLFSSNSRSSTSPEFEFWMLRNPSFPPSNLLFADQLFVNGVLLPLQLLPHYQNPPEPPKPEVLQSKRWSEIFKKGNNEITVKYQNKEKDKRKENKGKIRASSAELNINIWPFSRSKSSWNGGTTRLKTVTAAPAGCSGSIAPRSNSAGELKFRKWVNGPGRSSLIWQVRREGSGGKKEVVVGGGKVRVKLNVPMCIGYKHHLSCTGDHSCVIGGESNHGGGAGYGGNTNSRDNGRNKGMGGGNISNLRSAFMKNVH